MDTVAKVGHQAIALATWIYALYEAGQQPDNADLKAACDALHGAAAQSPSQGNQGGDIDVNALGMRLVMDVELQLGDGSDFNAVLGYLGSLYGADRLDTSLGGTREDRAHNARSYQFKSSLPWLAEIIDRFPDGKVGPHWVMVERVTDQVHCMDPYPWDDVDEEYATPVTDFMVKWELAGGRSIRWAQG